MVWYRTYAYKNIDIEERLAAKEKKPVNNKKLLQGVQGDGFLEKSPPGRRRQNHG